MPLSQDLFQKYGLNELAETVARTNPDGSKKTVRKTYKGHIKRVLKLSGNFDSVKKDIEAPDTLWSMMTQPDEVWNSQFGHASKEIEIGLPQGVTGQLGKAVTMARGIIPKDAWNNSVLGELVATPTPVEPPKILQNGVKKPPSLSAAGPRTAKVEGPRPKRNIKKRTYGDASFEGYGEGFVDDDAQDGGYSTGEGDERMGRKRPKKVCTMVYPHYGAANRQRLYNQIAFRVLLLDKIAMVQVWWGFEYWGESYSPWQYKASNEADNYRLTQRHAYPI